MESLLTQLWDFWPFCPFGHCFLALKMGPRITLVLAKSLLSSSIPLKVRFSDRFLLHGIPSLNLSLLPEFLGQCSWVLRSELPIYLVKFPKPPSSHYGFGEPYCDSSKILGPEIASSLV